MNRITNQQGTDDETFSYPMFRDLERAGEPYVDLGASRIIVAALGRDGSTAPGLRRARVGRLLRGARRRTRSSAACSASRTSRDGAGGDRRALL